jgi:hypothetical protein
MDLRENRRKSLVTTTGAVLIAGCAALAGACANTGPGDTIAQITAVDYGKPYLGMSKAEVLNCAGQPRSRIPAGKTTETLVYHYNGAGPVPGTKAKKFTCTASLTFEKGTLVRVSYAHMNVRSPYEWQSEEDPEKAEQMRKEGVPTCPFSLPRCPR